MYRVKLCGESKFWGRTTCNSAQRAAVICFLFRGSQAFVITKHSRFGKIWDILHIYWNGLAIFLLYISKHLTANRAKKNRKKTCTNDNVKQIPQDKGSTKVDRLLLKLWDAGVNWEDYWKTDLRFLDALDQKWPTHPRASQWLGLPTPISINKIVTRYSLTIDSFRQDPHLRQFQTSYLPLCSILPPLATEAEQ